MLDRRESLQLQVKACEQLNDNLEKELRDSLAEEVNEELMFPPTNDITVNTSNT